MANAGKEFEKQFKASVPGDVYILRIPDSAIGFNIEESSQRFAVKTPYDFVAFKKPYMYALELKSTSTNSVSFRGSSPMIKDHQVKALRAAAQKGIKAGLIINFRKSNNTYFVPIGEFDGLTQHGMCTKSSLSEFEISKRGNVILIPQRLKKVNYEYDLSILFKEEA